MTISNFKKEFDPVLEKILDEKLKNLLSLSRDPFIKDFVAHSKDLVFPGGKRIRPYLSYLTYSNFGGEEKEKAYSLFSSLEIFHTFALIHDDIMDKSETRHGAMTIHSIVEKNLKNAKRTGDLLDIGNSQAILVGDIFFGWAAEIFNSSAFEEEKMTKARKFFYKMIDEVALGQIIDVDLSTRDKASSELINEKIRMKTTMYTFIRPLQIGASLSNTSQEIEKFCEDFGAKLGFAFQMQDDLLDITGDANKMKKDILRDISSRQHTYFTNYVFSNGTPAQKKYLSQVFGKKIDDGDREKIISIFQKSGAIDIGNQIIDKNLDEAKEILESFKPLANKKDFLDLIEALTNRRH